MAESCVELDQMVRRFKLASPLAIARSPLLPGASIPLSRCVTAQELGHVRSPAAMPVHLHHLDVSKTGARPSPASRTEPRGVP